MEAGLHRHYNNCDKNPGHKSFIHSSTFDVNNRPLRCRDIDLANCVTSMIDLSISVRVEYVSESSQQFIPDTDQHYPGFSINGHRRLIVDSGWVHTVYRFPDKYNFQHKTCPCKECLRSEIPNPQFACIAIGTSYHVPYDYSEGENITCYLFLKEGSSPAYCRNFTELRGMWRVITDTISDRCLMIHVTHDMELASRLDRMVLYRDHLKDIYFNMCLLYNPPEEAENDQDLPGTLMSYPHGRESNVTLGSTRGAEEQMAGRMKYRYNTSICPGSSGGKIFVVWKDWTLWGFEHTHSRWLRSRQNINCSSSGVGYLSPIKCQTGDDSSESSANSEPEQETEGSAEVEECLAEAELHSGFINCEKNQDHKNFIPIHQLSEDHLPPGSRHLVEPIKALGNTVALVAVKQVSKERPETFPDSDIPYPRTALFGTCWVYKVIREEGMCQCEECQKSGEPRTNFAYIIIHTAAHVVFDNYEAKHTTCYLFFDEGDTLASCKGVVQLSGMSRVWSDAEKDVSKILYVTHDPDVIDCVDKAVHEWESVRKSLECKKFIDETMLTSGCSSADAEHGKLAIAVSHPHGCSKQVSIGECVSVDGKGNGQTVYNYTTPTCRGSSGCYVFVEGRVRNSWDDNVRNQIDEKNGFVKK